MSKTAFVRARIEPKLKAEAERVFHELGLTATQAIHLFYKQVKKQRDLPLGLHVPNRATKRAIKESRKGKGVIKHKNKDDFFDDLGI